MFAVVCVRACLFMWMFVYLSERVVIYPCFSASVDASGVPVVFMSDS